jgi:hypothetical protein
LRLAMMAAIAARLFAGSNVFAGEPVELQPFTFLIGEWEAAGSGQPGASLGTAVFSRGLQGRVILRTSYAEYPPADGNGGSRHDDLMVIYVGDGGAVRADYYDNEGHVIRYAVESPAAGRAVFSSDPAGGGPRFRLSYKLQADGGLDGEFEIAPPGAPDAFKSYLTWHSRNPKRVAR